MFFNFAKTAGSDRYVALIDIGSGSVGVSIAKSAVGVAKPETIWSYRERMPVGSHEILKKSNKLIVATTLNVFLALGNKGLPELHKKFPRAKISHIYVAISAPWSYTVTKTIKLNQKELFTPTPKLLEELVSKANIEAAAGLDREVAKAKLAIEPLHSSTESVAVNGYLVDNPFSSKVNSLTINQLTGFAESQLVDAIKVAAEKMFPRATLTMSTFMHAYFASLKRMYPDTKEACLVDVTSESTEIGIVRNNTLTHVTNMPVGTYDIARDVAEVANIPAEEALGYMRENNINTEQSLSSRKREALSAVLFKYEKSLTDLLKRTGDVLSIPKTVFLHTDFKTEQFFINQLKMATQNATESQHSVHTITTKYLAGSEAGDSALLLMANVFHKNLLDLDQS